MNTLPRLMGSNIEPVEEVNSFTTNFLTITSADGNVDRGIKYANINSITGDIRFRGEITVNNALSASGKIHSNTAGSFGNTERSYIYFDVGDTSQKDVDVYQNGDLVSANLKAKELFIGEKVELLNQTTYSGDANDKDRYVQIGNSKWNPRTPTLTGYGNALVRIHSKWTGERITTDPPSSLSICRTALEIAGGQCMPATDNPPAIGGSQSECPAFACYGAAGFRARSSGYSTVYIEPERYKSGVNTLDPMNGHSTCSFWNNGNTGLGALNQVHQTNINGDLTVNDGTGSGVAGFHGNITAAGDLTISRSASISGNLNANGKTNLSGVTTLSNQVIFSGTPFYIAMLNYEGQTGNYTITKLRAYQSSNSIDYSLITSTGSTVFSGVMTGILPPRQSQNKDYLLMPPIPAYTKTPVICLVKSTSV